jgi:hypothetical protein
MSAKDPQLDHAMQEFRGYLTSNEASGLEKAAAVGSVMIRRTLREESFWETILPLQPITVEDCDRSETDDEPRKIVDVEPDSPAALIVGLNGNPGNLQIRQRRVSARFSRIQTIRGTQDKVRLATAGYDVRKVFMDNQLRDALARYDGAIQAQVDRTLGAADSTVTATGAVQHRGLGVFSRSTVKAMRNIMPSGPSRMKPAFYLTNQVFFSEWIELDRTELGGDLAQEMLIKGVSMREGPDGSKYIVTIKDDLVPNNTYYMFAAPEALGVAYELESPTVHIQNEGPMISFYMYFMRALVIGNLAGIAKATFASSES